MPESIRQRIVARQTFVPGDPEAARVGGMVANSGLWSAVSLASVTVLQFVRSMVFARLMLPSDFGVIALANVIAQFILVFANFGFNASIIYHRHLDRRDLATCWWGNLAVDSMAAGACVAFAFLSNNVQDDPRMPYVMSLLALQFVLNSVGGVNLALMRRLFRFKHLAWIKISGAVVTFACALIGVTILHWGVYGLVFGMIAGSAWMSLLGFVHLPWLPSFTFSRAALRKHISYGRWLLGVTLVNFTNRNVDKAIIGTWLNSTQLGYYEYASNLPSRIVVELGNAINNILLPAYSSLKDDTVRLHRMVLRVMRFNALITYPLLIGLIAVAGDFVRVAYGERWLAIIVPIQLLCLSGLVQTTWSGMFPLCQGVGRPEMPFKWSLALLPLNIVVLLVGVREMGIVGVSLARLFAPIFLVFTLRTHIMGAIGLGLAPQLAAVGKPLAGSLMMAAVVVGLQQLTTVTELEALPRLLALVSAGAAVYAGFLLVACRAEIEALIETVKT